MLTTFKQATPEALAAVVEEKRVRSTSEVFVLFAMGSQFDHLIAQALGRLGVFCLVADPASVKAADIEALAPVGIILSGGPASAYDDPIFDARIFDIGIPVLGICLGFQMWTHHIGVTVTEAPHREFGKHGLQQKAGSLLFDGLPLYFQVLQSHGDRIEPDSLLDVLASTEHAPVAAARRDHLWGVQFHPEVTATEHGDQIFENFCFRICRAKDRFPAQDIAKRKIEDLARQIEGKRILALTSGGCDSSVGATLLREASKLVRCSIHGLYIKGVDRADDERNVREQFGSQDWIDLRVVDATEAFLAELAGKTHMSEKREAVRVPYLAQTIEEIKRVGADYVMQGTLYTDRSESGHGYDSGAPKAQIKLHHNVNLNFGIPELMPLGDCVKDGVREIGRTLGMSETTLMRHPFPGAGMVVRTEGEMTPEKLVIVHAADEIFIGELRRWDLYPTVWQAAAVLTQSMHTMSEGDNRGLAPCLALWAVHSVNGFTAEFAELPWDFIRHVSRRIRNEVRNVGPVVYRVSDKPSATIEWG